MNTFPQNFAVADNEKDIIDFRGNNDIDKKILEKNKKIHIRLRDANYQIIAEKQVQTSSYGSFNTDFILPKSGLTGSFTLETENGSSSFLVEEYKKNPVTYSHEEVRYMLELQ